MPFFLYNIICFNKCSGQKIDIQTYNVHHVHYNKQQPISKQEAF